MSLSPPRVRFNGNENGNRRDFRLYWCCNCLRTVRITSSNPSEIVCPRCFREFVYEIEVARPPRLVFDLSDLDAAPESRLLEALSLILDPPTRHERNRWGTIPERNWWGPIPGPETQPPRYSWIVIPPRTNPDHPIPTRNPPRIPTVDPRDYFNGSGLTQLIEELTQDDRPGPPPAPMSAIDAIPTVKIRPHHLTNDSNCCPICKEEFEIGGEAKEMPCKHVYHSNCIVPWLRMHNSCPVCRYELPNCSFNHGEHPQRDPSFSSSDEGANSDSQVVRIVRRQRCWRWSRLFSFWPFRWRWRWRCRRPRPRDDINTVSRDINN